MSEPLPIIITGARGRIGSSLCDHFTGRDRKVFGFSRGPVGSLHLLDDLFVYDILQRPCVVMHAAWSSLPLVSENHQGIEWTEDFPLLWRILHAMRKGEGWASSHFIFFSSGGSVYGNAGDVPSRESAPLHPIGWHGFAKASAEALLEQFAVRTGLAITRIRLSNPYGMSSTQEKPQGVIPYLFDAALRGSQFGIWGDGHAQKDFIHISDVLSAMEAIVANRVTGPVNVCCGQSTTILELVERIEKICGRKVSLQFGNSLPWDVTDSRLDNTLLRTTTRWAPRISLDEGLAEVYRGLAE